MKIYLTSRQDRRQELCGYRDQLRALGHEVVSSWLDSPDVFTDADDSVQQSEDGGGLDPTHPSDMSFHGLTPMKSRKELLMAARAAQIFSEILDCEALVAFTDALNHTREASYAEYGGALFCKKRVWIVGGRFHALHYYRDVPCYANVADFLKMLSSLEAAENNIEAGKRG